MESTYGSYNKLSCKIVIGDYDVEGTSKPKVKYIIEEVVEIKIKDSYETLTNTMDIKLPREFKWQSQDGKESGTSILGTVDSVFTKGDRITVYLGYDDNNKKMFDGHVVTIMPKTPYTLKCEDSAWRLKHNSIMDYTSTAKQNNLYKLLEEVVLDGTGVKPHPELKKSNIELGMVNITMGQSASQVLAVWKKYYGLLSFIKDGYLAVGRTFFSTKDDTFLTNNVTSPPILYFNERVLGNVVKDNLSFTSIDYSDLAVKGTSMNPDNTRKEVFVVIDPKNPSSTIVLKQRKITKGKKSKDEAVNIYEDDKILVKGKALRTVTYQNISDEELIANTKGAFFKFTQTGIEGSVTTFGDYGLTSAELIRLKDPYNPEKNGVFIISEVTTTFGVNGYRQTIKVPYKRSN